MNNSTTFYQRIKTNQLDGLELLKALDYNEDFPLHSHETFCVSLIENGTFKENEQFASTGSIFITNPNDIHSNDMVFDTGYSFKTLYISPDIFKKLNNNQPLFFDNNCIENPLLFHQLNQFSENALKGPLSIFDEKQLFSSLQSLLNQYAHQIEKPVSFNTIERIDDVKGHIQAHLGHKIVLEDLAKILDLDKFKFIRLFKKHIGLSPFSYITMLRIDKSKTFLQQGATLVDAALDAGFYDQSHYTNYFKHYVGVTPKIYQQAIL
jgi:AraC-like DNA-binding protein